MTEIVPLNQRELNITIGKLFISFPQAARRGVRIEAYVEALARIPLKYVQEACNYAIRGRMNDGTTIPPVSQIAQLAENLHFRDVNRGKALVVHPEPPKPRESQEFDPTAKVFSPYRLGMSKEEIISKVVEYQKEEKL